MRPRSCDSDLDEPSEDALLEAELARMHRSYRVMQNDYRSYKEETKTIINQQKSLMTSLERERVELDTQLGKMETTQNRDMDAANTATLARLACEEKEYLLLIKEERSKLKELNDETKSVEKKISEQRKKMGGIHNGTTKTIAANKKKTVLENRLDKAMVHFNKQLAINRSLREDIDHLRRERAVFENLYKKFSKELNNCKNEMREVIEASTQAFEQRDEAQNKMAALRERNEKDQQQHNTEVKDLQRIISHDNKVKEFMNIKNSDRADYISEEMAKRNRNGTDDDKGVNAEIETIRVYEEAFNKIKTVTGEDDIETIVEDFIKNEDENFALFNYVNELNSEVETLQEEVALIRKDIQAYKKEDEEADNKRHQLMRQLEKKYDKTAKETTYAEERLRQANKVLEELRTGIEMMFKRIGCDPKPIREMLGGDAGVTNKNIMIYLGQIEQRTTELLNMLHYTKMKKAEIEGQQTPPKTESEPPRPGPDDFNIQIHAPTTWSVTKLEDRDSEDDDHEDEPCPLSEAELRERVLRSLTRRALQQPFKTTAEKKPDTPNKDKKKSGKTKEKMPLIRTTFVS